MILKKYKQFINENSDYNDNRWIIKLARKCESCKGTNKRIDTVICNDCDGYGKIDVYDKGIKKNIECEKCNGDSTIEDTVSCNKCNREAEKTYEITYVKNEGVYMILSEPGFNKDYPKYLGNGNVSYSRPSIIEDNIKHIVRFIFKNKHLSPEDIVNKLLSFIISNKFEYTFDNRTTSLFNDDSKKLLTNVKTINKFNL